MNLDCQHVREVMDSYLSEELAVETNHGFLHHVAECRDCAAELTRRERLRALLSQTLDVALDADRMRARITHAVDREQRSWARVAPLGAIAATLVAAVAVARTAPTLTHMFTSVDLGDQAGTPAAGSIIVRSQKPTAANDVTPIDATTPWRVVDWIAIGT